MWCPTASPHPQGPQRLVEAQVVPAAAGLARAGAQGRIRWGGRLALLEHPRGGVGVTSLPRPRKVSTAMSAPASSLIIRPAAPEEFDEIIAIDDDSLTLYEQAGLHVDLGSDHPFARAERERWTRAVRAGNAFLGRLPGAGPVGLLVMSLVDGAPHLEQLSVRTSAMRRGIGRRLLMSAIEWAQGEPLWLTTYSHLPWNRPFYESAGFQVVPESRCGGEILEILDEQRRWLPAPQQRIAMRRPPG
jgi:GNAT superfamily N-acetyltransferase